MAISPPGFISVSGFGVSSFFYKNMLDELGIDINLFRVGEYKGAAETYVRTDFSKENEEQYLNLLNYRMSNYLDKISFSRAIDRGNLFNMIENFETELANDALNNKLVDSLIYEDEMVNYLKTKVDSSYKKISLLKYRKTLEKTKYNRNKIAVLYAIGSILPGTGDDGIYSESIIKEIKKIKKNKNIKSVVLYVNSGGGSAFASDLIARELELLNDEKPLVAYMSDVCASGGYYISMPADTLIASRGSIVGSIGVFGIFPEMSGLLNDKLKITTDQIRTKIYISVAFECPYEGPVNSKYVYDLTKEFLSYGINEVVIADTIGAGNPNQVQKVFKELVKDFGSSVFSAHFHDTRLLALSNVKAAMEEGITKFDSCIAGLGGCPFAPGASGNLATEDLVSMLHKEGYETGINEKMLRNSAKLAAQLTS